MIQLKSHMNPKREREKMLARFQAKIFPIRCHLQGKGGPTPKAIHEMPKKLETLKAKNADLCTKYEKSKIINKGKSKKIIA